MVQTQLASMFLGNPNVDDADSRLRGVNSMLSAQIHILDGQSNQGIILDYITAKDIISNSHKKSLEDTLETYNFITFADKRYSEYLEKRNRIIVPDEDGTLREFVMFEVAKYKDTEGYKIQVFSHASYLELKKATVLYPDSGYTGNAVQHGGRVLDNTGWQMGIVESKGTRTLTINNHTNPYEMLKRIAKEFELELHFRVTHDGNKITGRFVDMLERVGQWRGREVEFGKDLDGIRRVEKQDIVTALLGLGPEREDGTRIEVLIEDDDALRRWGRVDEYGKLHHLIEPYEIQSERSEMTVAEARQYTRTALNKRINESVTYECTIVDLENVPGMENKKIRFGDTIRIKDTHFNPPLYLEARVFEFDRDIKSQAKKDIKLGDYTEYTEEQVNAIWIMLQREIRKKIDIDTLRDYAEPKKVESDTAPEIKEGENPIWVDTSKTPKVPHVVIANQWQKMSPTAPGEVDAYTKQQVDNKAKEKADQALIDAKAFSENADNINKGVIDVGAIPLRTSVTGARIEWDGVNGFVQYDRDGTPVNWFNLDGELYATKGRFSGDVSGATGTFGDVTVTDGDFNLQDETSSVVYSATPKRNFINDHSFELVRADRESLNQDSFTYNWLEVLSDNMYTHDSKWRVVGKPKVSQQFTPDSKDALAMFGDKAMIVRNAHYVRQYIWDGVGAGSQYTVSAFFKRQWKTAGGGTPVIQIWHVNALDERQERIVSTTFPAVKNDYTVERHAETFTVPSNFQNGESLEVIVSGGNDRWIQCDGVQMVEGDRPSVYQPEDSIWEVTKGNYRTRNKYTVLWSGIRYPTASQTTTPDKALNECANGWMIEWYGYTPGSGVNNAQIQRTYIPNNAGSGYGNRVQLGRGGGDSASKYIYIYPDRIEGHSSNSDSGNDRIVMTGVYEW